MPALANPQMERFAWLLAAGCSHRVAWIGAGFRAHSQPAKMLSNRRNVRERIAEVQAYLATREIEGRLYGRS